jgi:hypothetical protein
VSGPPDQGLRYELAAVIGPVEALARLTPAHPSARVVGLETAGLGLLPVTADIALEVTPAALCSLGLDTLPGGTPRAARQRAELLTGPESGFAVLTPGLVALIEAASIAGPLAYLEADYLGREGRQAAALWRGGRVVSGPLLLGAREEFRARSAPVCVVLRGLGVRAEGWRDEFLVAGLSRYRRTEQWARSDTDQGTT